MLEPRHRFQIARPVGEYGLLLVTTNSSSVIIYASGGDDTANEVTDRAQTGTRQAEDQTRLWVASMWT